MTFKSNLSKNPVRSEEIYQGGGYLSQSSNTIYFSPKYDSLSIRWPDGKVTEHKLDANERVVSISQNP